MKDTFAVGVFAGIIGTLGMHLVSVISKALGLAELFLLEIFAMLLLNPAGMNTFLRWLVGAIVI